MVTVPADVAQLVERNLAKVEVASSSLVSRSSFKAGPGTAGVLFIGAASVYRWPRRASPAWWQSGYAADCKSAYAGSIPTQASIFPLRDDAHAGHARVVKSVDTRDLKI